MRKIDFFLLLIFLFCFFANKKSSSQEIVCKNKGAHIIIVEGTHFVIKGNLINDSSVSSNIVNRSKIALSGDFENKATYNSTVGKSTFDLQGGEQEISGTNPPLFEKLLINGESDKSLLITIGINDSLVFSNEASQKILLNANNLILFDKAEIANASNDCFIVTNDTGSLVKYNTPNDYCFPVGTNVDAYKPIRFEYNAAKTNFRVRVDSGFASIPSNNPSANESVACTYIVESDDTFNLSASLSLAWNKEDEASGFDYQTARIWQYNKRQDSWHVIEDTLGAESNEPESYRKYMNKNTMIQRFSENEKFFVVNSSKKPILSTGNDVVICKGDSVLGIASAQLGFQPYHYHWLAGNAIVSENDSVWLRPDTTTIYKVILTDNVGNTTSRLLEIRVNPLPTAEFSTNPVVVNEYDEIQFESNSTPGLNESISSYLWDFGDDEYAKDVNPIHSYDDNGDYEVRLVVENSLCVDDTTITINVLPSLDVWVASAFSPNGNGKNDILYAHGSMQNMSFRVYNNWGLLLFETKDKNKGWDGTYNGERQLQGNYIYQLIGTNIIGSQFEKTGVVSLLR